MTAASESLLAFTITMNRIVMLRLTWARPDRLPTRRSSNKTNRVLRHRHVGGNYFEVIAAFRRGYWGSGWKGRHTLLAPMIVMPRACGASSTPRRFGSIAAASGILDRPPEPVIGRPFGRPV